VIERQRYSRYHLPGILPANQVLVVDKQHDSISLLGPLDERCTIIEQQTFTNQEMLVLLELLEYYPLHSCPNALLLARLTGERVEEWHFALAMAKCTGDHSSLQSLRSLLCGCQSRLQRFGIDLVCIFETGYTLAPLDESHRGKGHNER
jgi:hypothetical protein